MKPQVHTLNDVFVQDGRYVVPLYQRPYVWEQERHWEPLWSDVEGLADAQLASESSRHFLGAIVLQQELTGPDDLPRRLVIDGQQRLITLQLLLAAAVGAASEAGAGKQARLLDRLIRNSEDLAEGDQRFKVWPTNADQHAFRLVMQTGGPPADAPDDSANSIQEAFAFFSEAIRSWGIGGGLEHDGILRRYDALRVALSSLLQIVSINLEQGDDAQIIFETLNARGTPLLATDLVKNAVFHRATMQGAKTEVLHREVWLPELGADYWREEIRQGRLIRPRAELFLTHWLGMKLGRIIPATELFAVFRASMLEASDAPAAEALLRELAADAETMRSFDALSPESVPGRFFRVIRALDTTTMYPVALLLFRSSELTAERRDRALRALESYLVRRMLMGLSAKNYTQLAARLVEAVRQDLAHADDVIIRELCASGADTYRWPPDEELLDHLQWRPMYGWVGRARLVLVFSELELMRRAEVKTESIFALPTKLSIEHILPQQWQEHWPMTNGDEELVERRAAMINVIGNLTLITGELNASLSNQPWGKKRQHLHQHSVLLLNNELVTQDSWDEDAIGARSRLLAERIAKLWPEPVSFAPDFDPARLHVPAGEVDPEFGDMAFEEVAAAYLDGSALLRGLLQELSAEPGRRRTYAGLEEMLGWSRGRLASVLGGYATAAKSKFGGRRPYRLVCDSDGAWWMWMDEERAAAVIDAESRSVGRNAS